MARNKEFDYDDKLLIARNLFWEKGYETTSINDLVEALKINRSSLYLAYGNKHDLFLKCLSNYIQQKEKDYRKTAEKSKMPLKAVESVIRDVVSTILYDTKTCLSVNTTFELGRIDKDVNKLLKQQALTSVRLFEELLSKAKEAGDLKTGKEPRLLAYFIFSSIASIWNAHILFSDSTITKQMADFLIETVTE